MTNFGKFKEEVEKATDVADIRRLVKHISETIDEMSEPIEWLRMRAVLYVKLDEKGHAINDYRQILKLSPDDVHAAGQLELLVTILRYSNSDIYANTNTHMDPWLE